MTVTHRSISIALEDSFGSLNNDGFPSPSGLSWVSLPAERDAILLAGDFPMNERLEARDGSHALPPEPDTAWDVSGKRVHRRVGTLQVKIDFTTLGDMPGTYDGTGLGLLMGAGFKSWAPATLKGPQTVTFSANNKFDSADVSPELVAGALLGYRSVGAVSEYTSVTAANVGASNTCSISPKLSIGNGDTVDLFPMETYWVGTGLESGQAQHSVAFRIDGQNFRSYAFGCKMQSLNITVENGRVIGTFEYKCAFVTDDHDGSYYGEAFEGPIEPVVLQGASQHFRAAAVVLSASPVQYSRTNAPGPFGEMLNRKEFKTETFSLTLSQNLEPLATSTSILTCSDYEITSVDISLEVQITNPDTDILEDMQDRVLRQLMVGTGPVKTGCGMCIYLPSAFLTVDAKKYEIGGEITRQTLTYSASRCGSDIKGGATDIPGNSFFRIGLGL